MRNAMITVEILISIVILFLVIATSVTGIKQLRMVEEKGDKYEAWYIGFHNITELLDKTICTPGHMGQEGTLSGMTYQAACKLVEKRKSFRKTIEDDEEEGNYGPYLLSLYKISLKLSKDNMQKEYSYYKTTERWAP
ncbi:MAG: hypothetical protein L3J47_11925 [Sulfurovum sp.]|nr:hypothetical protein [Sulfurovum sp.]